MINVTQTNICYYFPIDKKPIGNDLTLELYSELSLSSIIFDVTGATQDDFIPILLSDEMCAQVSNGEYNYTLYDTDGEKVSIGLIRFDLEEEGDTEYAEYEDFFDGFVQAIELEATGFTANGTYKVGEHQNGWNEVTVNVPLESTGFTENGTYIKADGGWNEVNVNIDTDFYVQSGYTSGYTDGFDSGYTSGYTNGEDSVLNYFYFQSRQDGSKVRMQSNTTAITVELEYSFDKLNWTNWDFTEITVNSGDTVYFRGNNERFNYNSNHGYGFRINGYFDIGGDIRSLLDKTITITSVPNYDWCLAGLFFNCNGIVNVDPKLLCGFTTLYNNCFYNFFSACYSLMNAPELPWTELKDGCYARMFIHCNSLVNAPELPAQITKNNCYWEMFRDCTNLNYIKCLASGTLKLGRDFTQNVASGGTFVRDINADWSTVQNGIPSGWTVLVDNVELITTAVTENSTVTAPAGKAFSAVTVDVPISSYRYPTEVSSALTPYHLTQEVWISPNTNTASVYNWFEGLGTGVTYNICAFYISVQSGDTIYGMQVGNYNNDDWANIDMFYWMDGSTSTIFTGVYLSHQFTKNYTGWMGIHTMQGNGSGYLSNLGNIGDYAVAMAINDNYEISNQNAAILTGKTFKFGKIETQTGFVG